MTSWEEDLHWNDDSSDENKESKFSTDMVFISRQNLIDWVHHVGKSLGYVIVTKRSKTSTTVFQCDRSGIYKSKKISTKNTGTKKINCPFELEGKRLAMEDSWTLRVICEMNNHEPALHLEGHSYARRLTDNEARLVEDLSRKNVKPRDILSILKQDPNNVYTNSTVYNARSKFRMLERAGKTQMQAVMSFFHEKSYVYESRVNHSTNELENLFFAHPKSLEFWHAFPHVVLIDATYQTNRYSLPILEIVGVTPTNKTFCIAFVLMHKEDESRYPQRESYLWKQIPELFHPYITKIQDVRGDGNCGFRAIAVWLGYDENQWPYVRRELLDELESSYSTYSRVFYGIDEIHTSLSFWESPAPEQHWMTMPETGILIANRFGVIFQLLTIKGSMTCFPLWKGPEEFQYHRVFTISNINNIHYVVVQLKEEYPMPTISALWTRNKLPSAAGWQTMYKSRLELYKKLKPLNRLL